VVWRTPEPVPPTTRRDRKYRRDHIVGGKPFTGIGPLIENFLAEVEKWKNAN